MSLRRGASIRRLLLGVSLFILLVPVLAVVLLRIYESQLIETTERRLIAESAVVAEAWREALWAAQTIDPAAPPRIQAPSAVDDFFPYEPAADVHALASPEREATRRRAPGDDPAWRAGRAVEPLLNRAKLVNLSALRVLDGEGCVVATTRSQLGECLEHLPEVRGALGGRYTAVLRPRHSDEPPPPLSGISRRGRLRVFTAMPVFADGAVVGVVRASRTGIDPVEALWDGRHALLWALLGCVALTAAVTLFFARTIVRPVRAITEAAAAIARGEPRAPLPERGVVPAEVYALGQALDTMVDQLRERAAYVSEFASNVSHELKTPLTSVRGAVELLRDEGDAMEPTQRARFLANIDAAAERMQRLVEGLLRLARIEHEADQGHEPVTLEPLLRHLVDRYEGRVELAIGADAPATLAIARAHLESALRNLLDNAVRHGGAGEVRLEVGRDGERALFVVSDQGPGISPANRERVFDRFFTTERDGGGTGLGLPIVQAIARSRGGRVDLETGAEGTTFRLLL